jgi:L-histidine N-alpha-methyltransferase
MGDSGPSFSFHDLAPSQESFRDAVVAGLSREPKSLPCKFFYDSRGSVLFEKICELPEYYLTRTEIAILDRFAADIAARVGPHCRLIELGSGASHKVRILLEAFDRPAAYVAVDISREQLRRSAARLAGDLPQLPGPDGKRVGFFPGSTIGNFEPPQVVTFLADWAALLGPGGEMLIGVDLKKDPKILDAAYNDKAGMNAAFNLNLLARINRELRGDFDVDRFAHVAFYNEAQGRVELYLKSLAEQTVSVAGQSVRFGAGELIHTENSYKYAIDEFRALAAEAGFDTVHAWTDRHELFSVHYLRKE